MFVSNTTFTGLIAQGADFSDAEFSMSDLNNSQFNDTILDGVIWDTVICPDGVSSVSMGDTCCFSLNFAEPASGCP